MLSRVAILVLACAAACAPLAGAQGPLGSAASRPLRLEGYWDRTRTDHEVIGDVTVSAEGYPPRPS